MDKNIDKFTIRSYGVQELALIYFPNSAPKSASQQFKTWLKENDKLSTELKESGYKPGLRLLTPRQVEMIIKHLGKPYMLSEAG